MSACPLRAVLVPRILYSSALVLASTVAGLGHLLGRAGAGDVHEGGADLEDQVTELGVVLARRNALARGWRTRRPARCHPLTLFGEPVDPSTVLFLGADKALVLELLQGGIDGARARLPAAAAALADFLDDLVTVHRLLGEQRDHRRSDVTPAGPWTALATGSLPPRFTAALVPAP